MDFLSKLKKLQQDKDLLIEKRLFEIAKVADKTDTLGLDNDLIVGALLYAKQASENKEPDALKRLRGLSKKIPSRKKSMLKKNKSTNKATV